METAKLMEMQRRMFRTGKTREYAFRMTALNRLEQSIRVNRDAIEEALKKDLNKSAFEAYMTEIGLSLEEIRFAKRHLKQWMAAKWAPTPMAQFPARSFVTPEPYGVVLIMAPWNYPFSLCIEPLVGAIAAGNCCVVKPSAYAPATTAVLKKVIRLAFPPEYVAVVEGGREENAALLEQRFDYIFFTGGVTVGKLVLEKAAKYVTPVTLELGGKSPCIVDRTANLNLAAKRLVFGKFLNSGQTCVAPDYLLVQEEVKDRFVFLMKKWTERMLGADPLKNEAYPRMVNEKHFRRVMGLIEGEKVVMGGCGDEKSLKIAPTLLVNVREDSPVMQEEIFGPVLPVLSFSDIREAFRFVEKREKPLALYLFTGSREIQRHALKRLSFGGGCINDTIVHLSSPYLGFGGVGNSGMGSYHGKRSFETFSHQKSILKKYNWLDLPVRYQPYSAGKQRLLELFLRG